MTCGHCNCKVCATCKARMTGMLRCPVCCMPRFLGDLSQKAVRLQPLKVEMGHRIQRKKGEVGDEVVA